MKPNPGDVLAEKYQLTRVLGEGGMSVVFAAVNIHTGKHVAIKWLQPELITDEEQTQRLLREAQLASSIDHPNVVNVFDLGRHNDAIFLVMELLHGESLAELLQRGSLEPTELIELMMPVLRGVHAAHRMDVVHRDLKPDNIFLCRDPEGEPREPKVLDFGISKIIEAPSGRVGAVEKRFGTGRVLTRAGIVFGTPEYTSPEQFRDARLADARSDVYALGVLMYYALSGKYPFEAETTASLAIRVVEGHARALCELSPELPPGLAAVVMQAMALSPDARFASIAALAAALEPFGDGATFSVTSNIKTGVARRISTVPRLGDALLARGSARIDCSLARPMALDSSLARPRALDSSLPTPEGSLHAPATPTERGRVRTPPADLSLLARPRVLDSSLARPGALERDSETRLAWGTSRPSGPPLAIPPPPQASVPRIPTLEIDLDAPEFARLLTPRLFTPFSSLRSGAQSRPSKARAALLALALSSTIPAGLLIWRTSAIYRAEVSSAPRPAPAEFGSRAEPLALTFGSRAEPRASTSRMAPASIMGLESSLARSPEPVMIVEPLRDAQAQQPRAEASHPAANNSHAGGSSALRRPARESVSPARRRAAAVAAPAQPEQDLATAGSLALGSAPPFARVPEGALPDDAEAAGSVGTTAAVASPALPAAASAPEASSSIDTLESRRLRVLQRSDTNPYLRR